MARWFRVGINGSDDSSDYVVVEARDEESARDKVGRYLASPLSPGEAILEAADHDDEP